MRERQNLTMRMHMRRYTRLANAFSKKLSNHIYMVAFYTVWYNWCRITEPPHWLCASCYGNGQKGILQSQGLQGRDKVWRCPLCKNDIKTSFQVALSRPSFLDLQNKFGEK